MYICIYIYVCTYVHVHEYIIAKKPSLCSKTEKEEKNYLLTFYNKLYILYITN